MHTNWCSTFNQEMHFFSKTAAIGEIEEHSAKLTFSKKNVFTEWRVIWDGD